MTLKDVLDNICYIYGINNNYISENRYKQPVFERFFTALGYINDWKNGIEEICFEVSDRDGGFVDIVVDNNILVEVKNSNISIENCDFSKQAFDYNSFLGKELVVITNFKKIKIFSIGKNNLLVELNLIKYTEDTIKDLYKFLSPFSLKNYENFNKFYSLYLNFYKQKYIFKRNFNFFKNSSYRKCPIIESVFLYEIYDSFVRYFRCQIAPFLSYLDANFKNKRQKDILNNLEECLLNFEYFIDRNGFDPEDNLVIIYNLSYKRVFDEFEIILKNIQLFLKDFDVFSNKIVETNIFAFNLDYEKYQEYLEYELSNF